MKKPTITIHQTIGTLGTSVYVHATINKVSAIYVAHNNTAQYEHYCNWENWNTTVAHDRISEAK